MLVFAFLVSLQAGCESENAKWNFAKAMNLSEEGKLEEAIALLQIAMEQAPNDCEIKLQLAWLLAENGQGELAIGICDEHCECFPKDNRAQTVRSTCLQYLGRFDESLAGYKRSLSGRVSRTPGERNNLAYYRGLAKVELSEAAEDIQVAIDQVEKRYWTSFLVPLQIRVLVSSGVISRHVGKQEEALILLDKKISQYESKLEIQDALIKKLVAEKIRVADVFDEESEKEILNARGNREIRKNSIGMMLITRALIHEDLDHAELADADRNRLDELGFEFSELAASLPSDQSCLNSLELGSRFLDTRGFISGLLEWPDSTIEESQGSPTSSYQESLDDLDLAVLSAQVHQWAMDSELYNSPDITFREVRLTKRMANHMTAVLLYHRQKVHERGGDQCAADEDKRRIEALGLESSPSLF